MKLIIIRHPETNSIANLPGTQDAPSPKGLARLSEIAVACRKEGASTVVHSPMPRAALAAETLATELGVPAVVLKGLEERNFGQWDKWDWPQISVKLSKLSLEDRYTFKPSGGESWQEMEVRLHTALDDIAALNYDTVAVMTHAGSIRVLLLLLGAITKQESIKIIPALGQYFVEDYDPTAK